jgi:hypothetical protein
LLISLATSALIILVASLFGESTAVLVGNLLYIPVGGSFAILAVYTSLRFGLGGTLGKAWLFFAIFGGLWFIAEMIWAYNDLILGIDPYPSIADVFWLVGYPLIFTFMLFYLKFVKKAISKEKIVFAVIIPLVIIGLTIAVALQIKVEDGFGVFLLTVSYPILDSIILAPAIIGIILFLKGEVDLLWSLISLGILSVSIADIGFFITQYNFTYYTGHPIEIFFYWAYILFSFGVYSQLKIFRVQEKKD